LSYLRLIEIRALLGIASHFCKVVVLELRTVPEAGAAGHFERAAMTDPGNADIHFYLGTR